MPRTAKHESKAQYDRGEPGRQGGAYFVEIRSAANQVFFNIIHQIYFVFLPKSFAHCIKILSEILQRTNYGKQLY